MDELNGYGWEDLQINNEPIEKRILREEKNDGEINRATVETNLGGYDFYKKNLSNTEFKFFALDIASRVDVILHEDGKDISPTSGVKTSEYTYGNLHLFKSELLANKDSFIIISYNKKSVLQCNDHRVPRENFTLEKYIAGEGFDRLLQLKILGHPNAVKSAYTIISNLYQSHHQSWLQDDIVSKTGLSPREIRSIFCK